MTTKKYVLIADENRDIRIVLRKYLELEGYRIIEADSAKQAFCASLQDDLQVGMMIIGDFAGGPEVALTLVHDLRIVFDAEVMPILMFSSHAFPHDRVNALSVGANEYMARPFKHIKEVGAVVQTYLNAA